jgi:hypothetical protein
LYDRLIYRNYPLKEVGEKGVFMKNIIKLINIIVLVAVIGFSMAACSNGGGGGGGGDDKDKGGSGKNITIKITGLTNGTKYYISPHKNGQAWSESYAPSALASNGTVSVSILIEDLKMHGFAGQCKIEYFKEGSSLSAIVSKNTYNMDSPATHTLNADSDFESE